MYNTIPNVKYDKYIKEQKCVIVVLNLKKIIFFRRFFYLHQPFIYSNSLHCLHFFLGSCPDHRRRFVQKLFERIYRYSGRTTCRPRRHELSLSAPFTLPVIEHWHVHIFSVLIMPFDNFDDTCFYTIGGKKIWTKKIKTLCSFYFFLIRNASFQDSASKVKLSKNISCKSVCPQ